MKQVLSFDWFDDLPGWMKYCPSCGKKYIVVAKDSTEHYGVMKPSCKCVKGLRFSVG